MPLDSDGRVIARGDDVEIIADRSRGKVIGFPVANNKGAPPSVLVLVRLDDGIEVSVTHDRVRLLEPRCERI